MGLDSDLSFAINQITQTLHPVRALVLWEIAATVDILQANGFLILISGFDAIVKAENIKFG